MNNKGFVIGVAVLMLLACIYTFSFTFVTQSVENEAQEVAERMYPDDSQKQYTFKSQYLDSMKSIEVYDLGIASFTYQDCKENQLNLGLDLQGGMSVTAEVETSDVLKAMAGGTRDQSFWTAFRQAQENYDGQTNFIDVFKTQYEEVAPNGKLAPIIYNRGIKDYLPNEFNSTNQEIYDYLKLEAAGAIDRAFEIISTRIDQFGVAQPNIQKMDNGRILVELPGVDDPERVRKLITASAKLEFWKCYYDFKGYEFLTAANDIIKNKNALAGDLVSDDSSATANSQEEAEPDSGVIDGTLDGTLGGTDSLNPDSPAVEQSFEDFKKENPVLGRVIPAPSTQGSDQWLGRSMVCLVAEADTAKLNEYIFRTKEVMDNWPSTLYWKYGKTPQIGTDGVSKFFELYALKGDMNGKPALQGDVVTDARRSVNEKMETGVSMSMNQEGTSTWRIITANGSKQNPQESVAIVLDNVVYSAPTLITEISNGSSFISGSFDTKSADDLANILKAGKLPAPAKISGETMVGPTLGKDSIKAGQISLITGFLLVIVFMILYYGKAGIYADIALLVNLVFIVGILAGLHASLTLPGMAGLVLTIGMAVDANVLIFERVREELQAGKSFKQSIKDGYSGAYTSIIDANITTLIAGVILWVLGKGPVMGFAVILVIGILSSLFTSIFLTRLFIDWDISKGRETSFYTGMTKKLGVKLNEINWDFIGKRKIFYMISGAILAIGIISMATRGVSYGVDFKGGWSYIVNLENTDATSVRNSLNETMKADNIQATNEVKAYGADNQFKITTSYNIESNAKDANVAVEAELTKALGKYGFTQESIVFTNKVGPTIATDTTVRSSYAIGFALLGIFIYIVARFRNWGFGLGATAALFHDVLLVFSLYSLLWGVVGFSLDIDQAFIAAILTVVGYSINDTVVVFDRVREFLGKKKYEKDFAPIINSAINSTLSRTLITSLTTLLVILILFIFGGDGLKGFTFALLIGVAVGTYSSVCIATPIVVDFMKRFGRTKS